MHIVDATFADWLLTTYGYLAIFLLVMLESAGIPLRGETILVSAAIYAGTTGALEIGFVIAAAAGGAILGDNIGFWVGRILGQKFLARWGHLIGLDQRKLKLGRYLFIRHGGKIVFLGRFVAFLRAFAAILAGICRFPPTHFFVWNAAGGFAWASLFGFGAYVLGTSVHRVAAPVGWAFALAALAVLALWRFFKNHEDRLFAEAEAAVSKDTSLQA